MRLQRPSIKVTDQENREHSINHTIVCVLNLTGVRVSKLTREGFVSDIACLDLFTRGGCPGGEERSAPGETPARLLIIKIRPDSGSLLSSQLATNFQLVQTKSFPTLRPTRADPSPG